MTVPQRKSGPDWPLSDNMMRMLAAAGRALNPPAARVSAAARVVQR